MAERRFGLLVASYDHADAGLSRLAAPRHDVEALAQVLGDPAVGGFDVQTVVNQPSYQVAREVEAFFGDRRPEDLLLFYFSGHGLKDEQGRLYFAMTNTERRLLGATALAASFVNEMIEQTRSRRNVMLLDCCYSGAFATERSKGDPAIHTSERFSGRGRTVLTASDSMQYAYEGDRLVGGTPHSVFTRLIVDGLESGDADRNRDGVIDLDELYEYVDDRIRSEEAQQRPSKWQWDVQGSVVIAQSVRGAGVPEDLRRAAASPFAGVRLAAVTEIAGLAEQQAAMELLQVLAADADSRVSSAAGRVLDGEPAAVDDGPKVSDPPGNVAPPGKGRGRSVEASTAPDLILEPVAQPAGIPADSMPDKPKFRLRDIQVTENIRRAIIAACLGFLLLATTWVTIAATSDDVIAVGSRPTAITTGFNSVWIANQGSNSISRVDQAGRKVVATVTVPAAPTSVAADDQAVWVATADGAVSRIDPASDKITHSQPGDAATLATGNGIVYLGGSANPTNNREIVKYLDPADFLIHDIREDVASGHIAVSGSVLWASAPGGPIARLVVNPNYGELSTIPATNAGGLIAAVGNTVWYDCDNNRTLCNLVGASSTPAPKIVIGADIRAIATDGTEVWLATTDPAQLVQINVATRKVTKHAQSGNPAGVALTKDAAWLTDASSDGRVIRVAR